MLQNCHFGTPYDLLFGQGKSNYPMVCRAGISIGPFYGRIFDARLGSILLSAWEKRQFSGGRDGD
eukprot:1413895-Ditylum_brightwellii.AAC.1